jgi:hypothetical protein
MSVLFMASYQLAAVVAFETTEYRNTFFMVTFFSQLWNIQHTDHIVNGKVKPLYYAAVA